MAAQKVLTQLFGPGFTSTRLGGVEVGSRQIYLRYNDGGAIALITTED